ncbi:MAG: serine protease [Desulfobacteraceae bacterium]|nr:serine protease [Desulfobacteraceae bacterium]
MVQFFNQKPRNVFGLCLILSFFTLMTALITLPVMADTDEILQSFYTTDEVTIPQRFPQRIPKIIGGQKTQEDRPWMAALIFRGTGNLNGQFCGCAVIDSQWVITASHCVEGLKASQIDVIIGQTTLTDTSGERIGVDRVVMHPDYNTVSIDNDIALLHLSRATESEPLNLLYPENQDLAAPGTSAKILGWGVASYPWGRRQNDLLEAEITIYSDELGQSIFGSGFTENMIVAGKIEGGVDTCSGDSGGPLIVQDASGENLYLTGITSWGYGCAEPNAPGVYAKVMNSTNWIEAVTGVRFKNIPDKVKLNSPSGNTTSPNPVYSWNEVPNATWYKIYVWDSNQLKILSQWYENDDICQDGTCTVTPDTILEKGNYEGFIKSWNSYESRWGSGMNFTVTNTGINRTMADTGTDTLESDGKRVPAPILQISPSETIVSNSTTFIWNEDTFATWYKFYLCNSSKTYEFIQWYAKEDSTLNYPEITCENGTCSITADMALEDDTYEWWIMGWNDSGFGPWSSGMYFTVR